jgi:hypothetical protein
LIRNSSNSSGTNTSRIRNPVAKKISAAASVANS